MCRRRFNMYEGSEGENSSSETHSNPHWWVDLNVQLQHSFFFLSLTAIRKYIWVFTLLCAHAGKMSPQPDRHNRKQARTWSLKPSLLWCESVWNQEGQRTGARRRERGVVEISISMKGKPCCSCKLQMGKASTRSDISIQGQETHSCPCW